MSKKRINIFALGGNEVAPAGLMDDRGHPVIPDIPLQWVKTDKTCNLIAHMIHDAPKDLFIITHGNGPQVGNILMRAEFSRKILPPLPLDVCDADSQGALGYMIGQLLMNELEMLQNPKIVTEFVTQVLVDKDDPDFKNPSKFIGPTYTKEEAEERMDHEGWEMKVYKKDHKGKDIWRRVVPSPVPLDIIEFDLITTMLDNGFIPITVGGGGIPVIQVKKDKKGYYHCNHGINYKDKNDDKILSGIEGVIDKDLASALLGSMLIKKYKKQGEDVEVHLTIFTGEDGAKLNYQKENEKALRKITLSEARKYYSEGHFPPGSMGPKMKAIINFLENGGSKAYITLTPKYFETLKGKAGTTIVPD
ncbi:MAG: carbamate kinase [Spirochaetes bacterium]|nr:carbamate kinase [Spirochaetota bacterium]